jgi:TM2 domain-containing membrane protein YozV
MKKYLPTVILVLFFLGIAQIVTGIPMWGGIQWMNPTFNQFEVWIVLIIFQFIQLIAGAAAAWTINETLKQRKRKCIPKSK